MKTKGQRQSNNFETEMNRPQKDDRFANRVYPTANAVAKQDNSAMAQSVGGGDQFGKSLEQKAKKGQWMGRTRMAGVYNQQEEFPTSFQRPGNFTEHLNKSYKSRNN